MQHAFRSPGLYAQAGLIMNDNYMEPHIPQGSLMYLEFAMPQVGQCGIFQTGGQVLLRQYCEDCFGNIYLLALNRSRRELDVTIPPGQAITCLARVMMDPLPLPMN